MTKYQANAYIVSALENPMLYVDEALEAFFGTVELKHGILADGDGQGVDGLLTAWD
eukprot:CAMPEP_0185756798 /NCGR_PEP_ID=MMETSP1174-20130828/15204_1 /TAXON_ID=35687 /ORGANISM="Dictyocha speculum, Strain CCMP1381" /LENGTH=55 /DNA_ID=CAMNT_0028435917 /DNA_START=18 /DNA_END=183 /DNA_ORIENTATION=+